MPFTLSVEVDGQHELDVALDRAADTVTDCAKYWPQVADVFYEIEKEQFSTEGARGGTPWASLSPAYAAWKERWLARETFDARNKILVLTGALKRSLTSRDQVTESTFFPGSFSGGAGIYIPEPLSLTLGSSLPYALAHQRGTANMPARPAIELKAEDASRLRKAFKDQVEVKVKRAGWVQDVRSSFGNEGLTEFDADEFSGLEWVDDL